MIEIITIKLGDDERRAVARRATKAAIHAGFSYAEWLAYRDASPNGLDLDLRALHDPAGFRDLAGLLPLTHHPDEDAEEREQRASLRAALALGRSVEEWEWERSRLPCTQKKPALGRLS